ncbi:DNA repair protein RadC [Roseomonas sp. CCTCC AB2023176]|uniref:RadC family protein n=1 Tax=Roseomonas sp. CCTCC AB2023176 TaxID=3342640 RepID=UPI0035D706A8
MIPGRLQDGGRVVEYPETGDPGGRPGFADAAGFRGSALADRPFAPPEAYAEDATRPFASTGPHGHRQRMREKLVHRGAEALADYELLEMVLFAAFRMGDTKPLAKSLINQHGSLAAVLAARADHLAGDPALGLPGAAAIKLVHATALRMIRAEVSAMPILSRWDRLIEYLTAALAEERTEQFRVLFLDPRNRLIADEVLHRGTVNHTPVYPREVVKRALELHATALILVHNHPSGDPTPSEADVVMTKAVKDAAALLEIRVHDHVIVGRGDWNSLRQLGLM